MTDIEFCELGRAVIDTEAHGVLKLKERIDEGFSQACRLLLECQGRIVVTGMGKSGHIGNKVAATLASTGSPAFFMHPGEASHGDLGMLTPGDVVLAFSYSGKTDEIITILPLIKRLKVPLISLTGDPSSAIAEAADVHLDVSVSKEACPLGLAPTASTTASLVMGDALAIALLTMRGFTAEDFALSHPGGSLGRRLLLRVQEIAHTGNDMPIVQPDTPISDAIFEITNKRLGMTLVLDAKQHICGVFTDGDVRRMLDNQLDLKRTPVSQVMSKQCKTITAMTLAAEALQVMEEHKITSLAVVDNEQKPIGVVHMHDILRAGVY